MAITLQSVWRRLQFADTIGSDRRSADRFSIESSVLAGSPKQDLSYTPKRDGHRAQNSGPLFRGRWVQVSYALIDFALACFNGVVAFSMRFSPRVPSDLLHWKGLSLDQGLPTDRYLGFLLLYAVMILLFCQSQSLYRTVRARTSANESVAVLKAVFFSTLLLSAFIYLSGVKVVSRLVVVSAGLLNLTTFIAWRLLKRRIVVRRSLHGIGTRNVLVIGAGRIGQALAAYLERNKQLGLTFKGFLDANHSTHPKLLGKIEDLHRIVRSEFIDEVLITIPSEREMVKRIATEACLQRLNVKVVPDLYDGIGWDAPIDHIGYFPVMELHWEPIPGFGLFLKRLIDICFSALGLTILSPILLIIGVGVRLDSPGPSIYRSQRAGKKRRLFTCYKFRTMVANADAIKHQFRHLNERQGPTFKISKDPRVTRVGKFLRKYSLDELPQLWNVLVGDMSLVGPRPHPLDDCEQYVLDHLRRLEVKPGITGLWQVAARKHPSFDKNIQLDLEYIDNWNLWLDLRILLRTLPAMVNGSGV